MNKKESKPAFTPNNFIVPGAVMLDKELQPIDSKVYAVIYWLHSMKDGMCFAGNKAISAMIGSSSSGVANSLVRLRKKGYIHAIYSGDTNQRQQLIPLVVTMSIPYSNEEGGVTQMSNITNNTKKEYMSETLKNDIKQVYATYLVHYKIDSDDWRSADETKRKKLLETASKQYRLTDKRKNQIRIRLEDCSLTMVNRSIINSSKNPFNKGDNDRGWKADLVDYILKSYEQVEKLADES